MSKQTLPSWEAQRASQPLSARGKAALRLLKQGKLSLREIGDRVGLSAARVHQIKERFL